MNTRPQTAYKLPSFALVGPVEAGKSTLLKALNGSAEPVRKTQAVEFDGTGGVDTPGEFCSHPRFFHALINSTTDADVLIYVHPANDVQARLPPGLLGVHGRQRLIGVISKTDLPDAAPERVATLLREQGFSGEIFPVSMSEPESVAALKAYLNACAETSSAPLHGAIPQ